MPNIINKVVYDGQTLIDLTQDTVTAGDVLQGVTVHLADGTIVTGTMIATSTPTTDTISKWDSDAHMNSEDMTSQEVEDFVDGLNVSGGQVTTVQFTPLYGSNYANYGNCYYQVLGKIVHVHLGISGLTANTGRIIYNLPLEVRPPTNIFVHGSSGSASTIASVEIRSNGEVYVYPNTNAYVGADAVYFVA